MTKQILYSNYNLKMPAWRWFQDSWQKEKDIRYNRRKNIDRGMKLKQKEFDYLRYELQTQLENLTNQCHRKSTEDIDHKSKVCADEVRRQTEITKGLMRIFSNFEKLLSSGPIKSKNLGGFTEKKK